MSIASPQSPQSPLCSPWGWLPLISILVGCMSLHTVTLTSIPKDRSRPVQVKESELVYLSLVSSNDFVDDVARTLAQTCRGGRISGILTKYSSTTYVPWILSRRTVEAKGYCTEVPE